MSEQQNEEIFQNFENKYPSAIHLQPDSNIYCDKNDIDFLFSVLSHSKLEIRAKAYRYLQYIRSDNIDTQDEIAEVLAQGIALKPGDRIHSVYKAAISYDDEFFHLNEAKTLDDLDVFLETHWQSEGFESREAYEESMREYEQYIPKRISQHVFRNEAVETAISLHRKYAFEQDGILYFSLNSDFIFLDWCEANAIDTPDFSGIDPLDQPFYEWEFREQVLCQLKRENNLEKFGDLCFEMIGSFSFIREEIVKQPTQLLLPKVSR